MISPSRNLYNCKHHCLFIVDSVLCLWIFCLLVSNFFMLMFVVVFLFTRLPFFTLVFIVILSSTIICKQICGLHCFVFIALVYNFNAKQSKNNTPVSGFFIFVTKWWTIPTRNLSFPLTMEVDHFCVAYFQAVKII